MPGTALIGGPLARPGNVIPGLRPFTVAGGLSILGDLAGRVDVIGETYDVGIGFFDPALSGVTMVGYVLTPGSQFQETTDLQDEDHLVQIASPLASDRYGRFPKVSQGDWSGGERQLLFVQPNQYYSSQQCDTSKPGHLRCFGAYTATTLNQSANLGAGRTIQSDGSHLYILTQVAGTILVLAYPALTQTTVTAGAASFVDITRAGDYVYVASSTPAVWQVQPGSTSQVSNDAVIANTPQAGMMAFFNGQLYYFATGNVLKSVQPPFPGAGPGTTVYTLPGMYSALGSLSDSGNGLIFVTAGAFNSLAEVFAFDGTTATLLGKLEGVACLDVCEANGVTYILLAAPQANGLIQPVIFAVNGSTISPFDDYRNVDPAFQSQSGTARGARLDSDGQYLYLFYPGLRAKQYNLRTQAIYDVGKPAAIPTGVDGNQHRGCATMNGGFAEIDAQAAATLYVATPNATAPTDNGVLTTSFYDFGTPTVDKEFKFVELEMNSALDPTAIQVSYRTDNLSNTLYSIPVRVSPSGNTLIAYLPQRTIGHRIQLQIVLIAARAPDIATYSVYATLARVWKFTVACREGQMTRSGTPDLQSLTPQQLQANIENARKIAGGLLTVWMPDPTVLPLPNAPGGVAQVNAQMQDFTRTVAAAAGPGLRRGADGSLRMDCDYELTISEVL